MYNISGLRGISFVENAQNVNEYMHTDRTAQVIPDKKKCPFLLHTDRVKGTLPVCTNLNRSLALYTLYTAIYTSMFYFIANTTGGSNKGQFKGKCKHESLIKFYNIIIYTCKYIITIKFFVQEIATTVAKKATRPKITQKVNFSMINNCIQY